MSLGPYPLFSESLNFCQVIHSFRDSAFSATLSGMDIREIRRENLRRLAEEKGGPARLADLLGRSLSQISQLIGANPTGNVGNNLARAIEDRMKLPHGWIDHLHSSLPATRENRGDYMTLEPAPPVKRMVPLISWVQAGDWCAVADPYPVGEGEAMVPLHGKGGPRTFALRVRGSSMEPEFWDGELIYIDPDAEYRHKSFVVVRLDDRQEATFKQLIDEGGKRYLKPLNPDWPEKIIEVGERASICGTVVGKYKEY